MACAIIFVESVFGLFPTEAVVPKSSESAERHSDHERKRDSEEHVRNTVINNQALHHRSERLGAEISPAKTGSVDGGSHKEVAHSEFFPNLAPGGCVHLDREWRSLISTINLLVG